VFLVYFLRGLFKEDGDFKTLDHHIREKEFQPILKILSAQLMMQS
jgi:hypothetical protein